MNPVPDNLNDLIIEACGYPPGSPQRQRRLTQLIRLISQRLWHENVSYYQDALQDTWYFFCRNLCEATTAATAYDSNKSAVTTWLNTYLKFRLKDGYINVQKQRATTISQSSSFIDMDGQPVDPIDRLPAPPDIPPLLEDTNAWAMADPDQILTKTHVKKHPHITCQLIILKRLPPDVTPWKDLSGELGVSISTLSSFYQRQCQPLLRQFLKSQGYNISQIG